MRQNFSGFCMEEFPQYKAYNNGLGNLTTVELISLVIGTGTQKNVEQARQIFNVMEESLRNIAKARVEDLGGSRYRGFQGDSSSGSHRAW